MKLVETKTTKTGTDFEGNRAGCICNGTVAVANSHDAGPAYCVGYCGNSGVMTRNANADLARTEHVSLKKKNNSVQYLSKFYKIDI